MNRSDTIVELATALAKAQSEMAGAIKGSNNPFFGSTYADLAAVWDACRDPLAKNGLAILQPVRLEEHRIYVTTLMVHASGEWISEELSAQPGVQKTENKRPVFYPVESPQAIGSTITYLRRYGLAAMVGIAQVDDDGESAMGRNIVIETLSREQVGEIIGMLDIAGVDEHEQQRWLAKLAKRYGVSAVDKIPVESFESAKATISSAIDTRDNATADA